MYHCVSINKMFSAMDKGFEMTFLLKINVRKDLYSMIVVSDLYLRRLSYYFRLANDHIKYFKQ